MKAMILAAGYGTRLKPLTDTKPKALVEICGKPLLEIVILKLKKHGFDDIIINVHHFAEQVIDFVNKNNFGVNIRISDEREKLLDTGGGILKARKMLNDEPAFLVYNVDILSDIDLLDLYHKHISSGALATLAVKKRTTSRQLLFDAEGNLCQWKNVQTGEIKSARKPVGELTPYAFSGIHILSTEIFDRIRQSGVFSIMDTYLQLSGQYPIKAYIHNYSCWYDMGKYELVRAFNKSENLDRLL